MALYGLYRGSIRDGSIPVLGSGRGLGGIFTVISKKRMARKLRRIIPFHFGLVIFRFRSPKNEKDFMFMIFEPSGRVHDSQKPITLKFGYTKLLQIIQDETKTVSKTWVCWDLRILEIEQSNTNLHDAMHLKHRDTTRKEIAQNKSHRRYIYIYIYIFNTHSWTLL